MSNVEDATQLLKDYYRDFSTLKIPNIVPYFHEPCLFVSPQGVMSTPTHNEVSEAFKIIAEGLRAKGYSRSELIFKDARLMSASAVLVIGVAVRYKTGGDELERVGVSYLLHKSNTDWKIAVTVIHDEQLD